MPTHSKTRQYGAADKPDNLGCATVHSRLHPINRDGSGVIKGRNIMAAPMVQIIEICWARDYTYFCCQPYKSCLLPVIPPERPLEIFPVFCGLKWHGFQSEKRIKKQALSDNGASIGPFAMQSYHRSQYESRFVSWNTFCDFGELAYVFWYSDLKPNQWIFGTTRIVELDIYASPRHTYKCPRRIRVSLAGYSTQSNQRVFMRHSEIALPIKYNACMCLAFACGISMCSSLYFSISI